MNQRYALYVRGMIGIKKGEMGMGEIKDNHKILWKDATNKRVMNTDFAEKHIHENPEITIFSTPMKVWQLRSVF